MSSTTKKWTTHHKLYLIEKFKAYQGWPPYDALSPNKRINFGWNYKLQKNAIEKYRDAINGEATSERRDG